MRTALFLLAALLYASPAFAQTIYEPTRYQYGTERPFYYGGDSPRVFARAYASADVARRFEGRGRNLIGTPLRGLVADDFIGRPAVYTDYLPWGDASAYGYTPADALNEANERIPRYFRKRDLLPTRNAVRENTTPTTPARGTIEIKPYHRPTTRPVR